MNTNTTATSTSFDLNSDSSALLVAAFRNEIKTLDIIFRTTGSVSIISSTCLALHILRSHDGLSTTYHRLVFGLSVADITASLAIALSSTMVPKELNYVTPYAQGNTATCTAQGFLTLCGYFVAMYYSCSICCYYLAIIRYKKTDEYIRRKLEPWFHGISIALPLVYSSIYIAIEQYNSVGPICFVGSNEPVHCDGYKNGDMPEGFSIPCGRGDWTYTFVMVIAGVLFGLIIPPIVIVVATLLMYRTVSKIEKNLQKYGVRSLRRSCRTLLVDDNATTSNNQGGIMWKTKKSFMKMIPCFRQDEHPAARRSSATSQKRAILHIVTCYVLAWALIWIPFVVYIHFHQSDVTAKLAACLVPLQGLFNFLVFMFPKVRITKGYSKGAENLTWCQAFFKTYMSRGNRRRRAGRGNTTLRNTRARRRSTWPHLQRIFTTRTTTRGAIHESNARTTNHQSNPVEHQDGDEEDKDGGEKASYHLSKDGQVAYSLPPTLEKIEQP
jgi:hypothetical protein